MSKCVKKTVLHMLEVGAALAVAIYIMHAFGIDTIVGKIAVGAIAIGLPKLMRASDNLPIGDYVNEL